MPIDDIYSSPSAPLRFILCDIILLHAIILLYRIYGECLTVTVLRMHAGAAEIYLRSRTAAG